MLGDVLQKTIWYIRRSFFWILLIDQVTFQNQEFQVADAFDVAKILQFQRVAVEKSGRLGGFNKIFIDLNGSRDIGIVHACLEKLQRAIRPELIVVKSIKMKALVLQCIPFESGSEPSEDTGEPSGTDGHSFDVPVHSSMLQSPALSIASLGL